VYGSQTAEADPADGPAGYTTQAAWAAGEAGCSGRIVPGVRADPTALAVDPLQAPPDELADAPVVLTTVSGSIVHRSGTVGGGVTDRDLRGLAARYPSYSLPRDTDSVAVGRVYPAAPPSPHDRTSTP
jgi:hypothetical protein